MNKFKIQEISSEYKDQFNKVVNHPLQSWEWGEFRKKTGVEVVRLGVFDNNQLKEGWQLFFHSLPKLPFKIGYFPRGPKPNKKMLMVLEEIGKKKKAIFIKIEPNVAFPYPSLEIKKIKKELLKNKNLKEGKPLFTRFSFWLDLKKDEEEILKAMKPKTRYNIRLAFRKGVKVEEDNSFSAFKIYLNLLKETTKRQKFYAHTPLYHQLLWETLKDSGIYHLLLAKYQKEVLAAYIFFTFKDFLYYPYGASTRSHKELMAPYALFWQAIKMAKEKGCCAFDMWGALGPNPSSKDPWFGFHRFKEGFNPQLMEFLGSFDLVLSWPLYFLFRGGDFLRWFFLRFFRHLF
ncbi:MAG: lipid II:glycine glycyltransferase FemX [Microgenomates group bacterium]